MDLENFKYNLAKLKKCNQYWDEMNPVMGGRHCSKCDKTIVDFSNMSFTDIAFFMSESKESVCGFYLPEQLAQIKKSKSKFPVTLGLSTLLTTSVITKAEKIHPSIENFQNEKKPFLGITSEASFITDNNRVDTIYLTGNIQTFDTIKKVYTPIANAPTGASVRR